MIKTSNLTDRASLAYLQIIRLQWILTAERRGSKVPILYGDLNATCSARERGGQHLLGPWAEVNNFTNGPSQIADRFGFRMITRQKNDSSDTWIDHIINIAEQEFLDVKAAYINHNPKWEDIFRTQRYSSKIYKRLCKKYEAKDKRSSIKDGWSPEYMVHMTHLNSMIEIRRHVTGVK